MTMSLEERFGTVKPVIAMVHFPGLPGRPRHDREAGPARLLEVVGRDLQALQDAGVDAVLFCNEADIPYQRVVGPEIPAAMAAVIGELRSSIRVPFGVNILWDARASLALARATGAGFIREVLTGVYESDVGLIAPELGDLAAYREAIGAAGVALFGNITPEFSSSIGTRSVAERARGASFLGLDAILISGPEAGVPMAMGDLRAAKSAAGGTPVLANTGAQADTLEEIFAVADGVIVGTSLKVDGITWNPVDPVRARSFVQKAREVRASVTVAGTSTEEEDHAADHR
jgi:membrane complex biogenesis BtpA family protein